MTTLKLRACSKCGTKTMCHWMDRNNYLCSKCKKLWDIFIHEEPRNSNRGWDDNFERTWRKYWEEFTPREKVVFT